MRATITAVKTKRVLFAALSLAVLLTFCLSTAAFAALNHTPVGRADSYTVDEDTVLSVTRAQGVLINDSDRDGDRLRAILVRATDHGTVSLSRDGSFMYDPAPDFAGSDSFSYKACEVLHPRVCSSATPVQLGVLGVNDPPVLQNDSYQDKRNRVKTVSAPGVLANDSDPDGDTLTVSGYTKPVHGRVHVGAGGSLRFVPDKGFVGLTSFKYSATDGSATRIATATIRVRK